MRTVYVMRHCKSRWDEKDASDIERRLTPRGKRDARAVGANLALSEPPPDLVISSPARRSRSTAKRVAKAWGYEDDIVVDERLYEGTRQGQLQLLRETDDSVQSLMLIGHNPGLEELVFFLGDRPVALGTGTVVRIDLPIERWDQLDLPADGTVRQVWEPQRS